MTHEAAPHDTHGHGDHGAHPHVNYFGIFIALCICTGLSILFDLFDAKSGAMKTVVVALVLSVACAKAMFVLTYFMHLKFEGNWKFIILLPTTILAIGLMFALAPDIGLHYYEPDVPQVKQTLPAVHADNQGDHAQGH